MFDRFIYWLALGLITLIRQLPLGVCFLLGQGIGFLLWAILPGYRRLTRQNLTSVFDQEKSPAEIRRLTLRHFTTLGANAVSAFKIAALSQADILRIAPIERLDRISTNIAAGRGVVLAINHIGNWELYAQLVFQVPEAKFGTVYQALRHAGLDDLINGDRRRLGVQTFDRKKGFNRAVSLLREPGIVGVLVDQNAGDGGIWMPFFNRLSSTSPLAATLAMRTNSVVIPVAIFTTGFAKWRVVLSPEIPWDPKEPEQLTADINVALEQQIRQSPADWFWVHNRWKMPWPNFLTASQRRGTYLPPAQDPLTLRPFRIVVRSPNWLGDAVMSAKTAAAFKHGRPDARLAILTPAKLAPFWETLPEVDEIIRIEPKESVFSVAKKLRGKFEVAILFPNSLRSALEAWLADIPRRVGFVGHRRSRFLNQIIPEKKKKKSPKPEHHADRYWRIAERCGAVSPDAPSVSAASDGESAESGGVPPPESHAPPNASAHSAIRNPNSPIQIAVCPGAEYGPAKRWLPDSFRETMRLVTAAHPAVQWTLVGTATDSPVAEEILTGYAGTNATNLCGQTSLGELITHLRTCDALLTNDTGTMHLADSLGVPLVSIFGSTDPTLTAPRAATSIVLHHQVECSPCFLRECPLDFRCMKAVTPAEAATALKSLL